MKLLSAALVPAFAVAALSSPSVDIDAGTVNGGKCDGGDAVFYKSIPYAEPPVGKLRFEAPKAYKHKYPDGELNATASAPTCIQFSGDYTPSKLNSSKLSSEDCLYLDVWTPSHATKDSKLPVKVWIYGGSNTEGSISDPLFDGCNTAEGDSVLVTVNYRLGPLGNMGLNSAGISGNQGIKDLLLGLEWVQDNIAAFGGDPKKVLLFGQSAGAKNAYIIGSLPQAPKLVNGIIAESGAGKGLVSKATLQAVGASYAKTLKCSSSDKSCLQSKSVSEIQRAFKNDAFINQGIGKYGIVGVSSPKTQSFGPYVDGETIPADPIHSGVTVPTVFGFTQYEGTVFATEWGLENYQKKILPSTALYKDFLRKNFGPAASLVEKYYKPSAFESYAKPIADSGKLPGYNTTSLAIIFAMSTIITDSSYRCPALHGAQLSAKKNIPAWTYNFKQSPTCTWLPHIDQRIVKIFAGTHTAEIPYVFGNLDNHFLPGQKCNSTAAEYRLSEQMMDSWTAMAKNADPSTSEIDWPEFKPSKNISAVPGVVFDNNKPIPGTVDFTGCELWTRVTAILSGNSSTTTPSGQPSSSASPSPSDVSNAAASIFPASGGIIALCALIISLV